jgi:hypothetical protein
MRTLSRVGVGVFSSIILGGDCVVRHVPCCRRGAQAESPWFL